MENNGTIVDQCKQRGALEKRERLSQQAAKDESALTTATASEASSSVGDMEAKYAMLAIKYTTVTSGIEMRMARGRFLENDGSFLSLSVANEEQDLRLSTLCWQMATVRKYRTRLQWCIPSGCASRKPHLVRDWGGVGGGNVDEYHELHDCERLKNEDGAKYFPNKSKHWALLRF